jgi:hypothetical protein
MTPAGQRSKCAKIWISGPRVILRWVEVPDEINGYSTKGSRVELNLVIRSRDSLLLTVFSNSGIVYRGNEEMQLPILLTQNAQPGQKFLVAARINCANVATGISDSNLSIMPPSSRPDPSQLSHGDSLRRPVDRCLRRWESRPWAATRRRGQGRRFLDT